MKQFFKCVCHKGNNIISLSLLLILLFISGQTKAQDAILSGANHAWTGEKRIYTVSNYDEIILNLNGIEGFYWDAFSGPNGWLKKVENDVNGNPIIVDVGQNIDFYQWWDGDGVPLFDMDRVAVEWAQSGSNHITYLIFDDWDTYYGELAVTVEDLQAPNNPTVGSSSCGQSTLTRVGIPPLADVTWYWQGKDANGTAIDKGSGSSFIANEGSGTYYIRARSDNGVWSSTSGSVYVYINESTTWYLDQDDDGLGDPNISLQSCIQPVGYVNNSSDNCSVSDRNFIYTITPTIETTDVNILANNSKIENITYFDGLGRPMQNIGIQAGGGNEDIVTHIEYDGFGRQEKEFFPYAAATNCGMFRTDALTSTNTFYNTSKYENTTNPYSKKEFETSPLNRVLKQAAPGASWALGSGHEIKMDYQSNAINEVKNYEVILSFADNTYTPILTGGTTSYNANELYKTVTKDENWITGNDHTTEEFKDKQGKVVLKRTYNNGAHDTYYVYDDYGNLTYVLPPKVNTADGVSQAELDNLCYQYKYDTRNRLVEKKLPGKGNSNDWEEIVYNKLDQPILTRDPNLKAQNKWLFTKYDASGRVAYTGLINSSSDRITLQNVANGINSQYVTKSVTAIAIAGTQVNYNNGAYPNVGINDQLHTINYYDDYNFDLNGANATGSYHTPITNAKGLATGSKVRILGTTNWITNVNYFDAKGRSICSYSKNDYLETTNKVNSKLDFVGKVLETTSTHVKNSVTTTVVDVFTYDHAGRLTKQTQAINGAAVPEVIVENVYDELGQLKEKGVGGKITQSRLQAVDYTYNIRGWLKGINDVNSIGNDLFAFKVNYNDIPDVSKKLYNGNISQTLWKTANTDTNLKNYIYTYDALNRLTLAESHDAGRYNESMSYDKNGNMMSLLRLGSTILNTQNFGPIDNLSYVYDAGNKLLKVEDSSNNAEGFNNGSSGSNTDYTYDANGNMQTDANKGITTAITYNHLNLPMQITFPTGNIQYVYDATGVKQRKIVSPGVTTDYAGGFIYENNNLKFFSQPEGYVSYNSGTFDYIYQYKDHLGNIRLSYGDSNNNGVVNSAEIIEENNYYPFGLKHQGYNSGTVLGNGNAQGQKYKFQGQERQDELGLNWDSFKYRNYDMAIGRFMSIDPLAEKYAYQSPYNFSENRVIDARELEGLEAEILFNKSTHTLRITPDKSKWNTNLPTRSVSAFQYNPKETKFNQLVTVKNVFTGGKATDGVVERDPERPQQQPIPNGNYDILDNDADNKHNGWFRLDKQDFEPYNDKDDVSDRDGFRFHLGTESWGCVTCDVSKEDRTEEWSIITNILNSTTKETVPEKRGNQGWNPFSWLTNFGTLTVIGDDTIKEKKKDE